MASSRTDKSVKSASRVTSTSYPLEDSVGFLVGVTNRKLQKVLDAKIAGSGVTAGTWHYMRVLWQENGISQGELAKRTNTSAPTTNGALRKLQLAGLVALANDPTDGRRWNVNLTRKGRQLEEKLLPVLAETNRVLTLGLTRDQVVKLRRVLALLQSNAEKAR